MFELLSGQYADWVRLASAVAMLSLPALLCVLVVRLRDWKWMRLPEILIAVVVVSLFLYNLSFIRS